MSWKRSAAAGLLISLSLCLPAVAAPQRQATISIGGRAFRINGKPTYAGRTFRGMKVEGLLFNSRMVQGIFDDRNPATRHNWDYPDGPWDADRNTREFVAAMPSWRGGRPAHLTINHQRRRP